MDQDILLKAKAMASREYTINISVDHLSDGTSIFMAKDVELMGCMAQGVNPEEAIRNLYEARVDYIYDSIVNSDPIPVPNYIPQNDLHAEYIRIDLTPFFHIISSKPEEIDFDLSKIGERVDSDSGTAVTVSNMSMFASS